MQYNPHVLTSPLTEFIETIFHFKDFVPDHSIERVIPTGHVFLLFELDDIPRKTFHNDSLKTKETFSGTWVSGMHKNYLSISAPPHSEMIAVQFKSSGAFPFFQFPMENINDQVKAADTLFGNEIVALRNEMVGKSSAINKFKLLEKWLIDRLDVSKKVPRELTNTLLSMTNDPSAPLDEILKTYPMSKKNLIEQFKKYIGLTPKYFQRILRFNALLQQIQFKKSISWSQVAYGSGFSDQSHFIKEFKHFSGFNPQEFINEKLNEEEANFFPVDKKG